MAKKQYAGSAFDQNTSDPADIHFSKVEVPDSGRIVARPIPLNQINPDRTQPRRAIPTAVRVKFPDAPPMTLLAEWQRMVEKRMNWDRFDPVTFIIGNREPMSDSVDDPLAKRYLELLALASTILRDGLLNPITIAPAETVGTYILETGERRFLAFNLLANHIDLNQWNKIPARVMDIHDIWRQAVENNAREELNPIEKARQLALLYMSMYPENEFISYESAVESTGSDRAYYAQAFGLTSRKGQGQRLLDAMGVNNRASITMYKRLLLLTDEEWAMGDAENASLNTLLTLIDEREGTNYGVQNRPIVYSSKQYDPENTPSPVGEWVGDEVIPHNPLNTLTDDDVPQRTPAFNTPTSSPWNDPHTNRIHLQPSDTVIPGGRSGVNIPIIPENTPSPFTERGQGEVSRHGHRRGDRVTVDQKTFGTVQEVLSIAGDRRQVVVRWDNDTTSTINDAFLERALGYQPFQPAPEPEPYLVSPRAYDLLQSFHIVMNTMTDPQLTFCQNFIEFLTESSPGDFARLSAAGRTAQHIEQDLTRFAEIFETELSQSIVAVMEHLEITRQRYLQIIEQQKEQK